MSSVFKSQCSLVPSFLLFTITAFAATGCGDVSDNEIAPATAVAPNASVPRTAASDPEGYAKAIRDPNYTMTASGLVHRDCMVQVPSDTLVTEDGVVVRPDGTQSQLGTCEHPSYSKSVAQQSANVDDDPATASQSLTSSETVAAASSVDSQAHSYWTANTWLSRLVQNVTVPSNPATKGAIIEFTTQLAATGGGLGVLQPSLVWTGTSWYMAASYIWATNRKMVTTSSNLSVQPGDSLWAGIESSSCRSDGTHCRWTVTMRNRRTAEITSLTVVSYDKYNAVQGGGIDYGNATSCSQLPANGAVTFSGLQILDGKKVRIYPTFGLSFGIYCNLSGTANASSTQLTWSTR